jgi:hypothetical protein
MRSYRAFCKGGFRVLSNSGSNVPRRPGTQAEDTGLALQLTADQEAKPHSSPNATRTTSMPFGYLNPPSSFMTVKPGQAVLFSLPRDHVSATWHVEITFRFAAKNTSHFRAPSNFLAIYAKDLLTQVNQ